VSDTYVSRRMPVEVRQWGPSWEKMLEALDWLATTGTYYKFYVNEEVYDEEKSAHPKQVVNSTLPPVGLPRLIIYTHQFDHCEPRHGHYLVKYAQGDVRVLNHEQYRREIEPDEAFSTLIRLEA
jgi:hypothetical protein